MVLELRDATKINKAAGATPSKLCGNLNDLYCCNIMDSKPDKSLLEFQVNVGVESHNSYNSISSERQIGMNVKLYGRLKELELERNELEIQRSSSCVARNLIYPVAMLLLLLLTSITVLLVMQNTIELLIGIKALPLSSRVSFRQCYVYALIFA